MTNKWKIKLCSNGLYYLHEGMFLYRNNEGEYLELDGAEDAELICELLNSYEEDIKALQLLLRWAVQCDFGLDNIATDLMGRWDEDIIPEKQFSEETKDMDYTESLIHYAKTYLKKEEEN